MWKYGPFGGCLGIQLLLGGEILKRSFIKVFTVFGPSLFDLGFSFNWPGTVADHYNCYC
jgi:hypothetical protein